MVKKKKDSAVIVKKGKREYWNIGFTKGEWFNPLKQNQILEGVYVRSFKTESKFKNTRENSTAFGEKAKVNYEFARKNGAPFLLSEMGGQLQALMDSLQIGDLVHIHYYCLKREDGELCPRTVKTFEQLKKWKGRLKTWKEWVADDCWVERVRG